MIKKKIKWFRKKKSIILLLIIFLVIISAIPGNLNNNARKIIFDTRKNPKTSPFCDLLGKYHDGGTPQGLYVVGSLAYVADRQDGLEIIEVSDPTNPRKWSQFNDGGIPVDVVVSNNIAYIADTSDGLEIIDVSDPFNPSFLGKYGDYVSGDSTGTLKVSVKENYAYILEYIEIDNNHYTFLEVIDVSDPSNPTEVGEWTEIDCISHGGLYIHDDLAFITFISMTNYWGGFYIIDISDPTNPQKIGKFVDPDFCIPPLAPFDLGADPMDIFIVNDIAYLTTLKYHGMPFAGFFWPAPRLLLVNVSDLTNPIKLGEYRPLVYSFTHSVFVSGDFAFLACDEGGFHVVDITNPAKPKFVDNFFDGGRGFDVFVSGDVAYVTDLDQGLELIDLKASPPDAPYNLHFIPEYYSINITWDIPKSNGAEITQYHIYRGDNSGGDKIYVGSSTVNHFLDPSLEINRYYYYVVTAENMIGEGVESEELEAFAAPYVKWQSPEEGERVILPVGDANFSFSYKYAYLDDVRLYLNYRDYGSVKDKNSTILTPYTEYIDGPVIASLNGSIGGNLVTSDTRNFIFGKLITESTELIEQDTEYIGSKLYLILHDPNGDRSFTSYEEATKVSMGIGFSIAAGISSSLKTGMKYSLFGLSVGYSQKLTLSATLEAGFDFRYEITETTELSSNREKDDADYIGPGYGDIYWGEAWTLKWELVAKHREYFNGTESYEDPSLYYGIIRGGEVLLNDYNAPQEWRDMNPVHNGWQNVVWGGGGVPLTVAGGQPFVESYEVASSLKTSVTVTIGFESETCSEIKGFGLSAEGTLKFSLDSKFYAEAGVSESYKITRTIWDDDPSDTITQWWGIDQTFGTYIFRTEEFMCETSYPLEHNTYDYLPPIIGFPSIDLDSNQDGTAPCKDDSPIITIDIFDEGGIASALIYFSINDGLNWDSSILSEQIANPGTWEGTIPAHDHGFEVIWYIMAWDFTGRYSNRTDPNGNPYKYAVINRAPTASIIAPIGGESYQDMVNIDWSGSDPDDDTLTYSLAYNLDNTGWHLIQSGLTGTSYNWDVSGLASDNVLLKIIVSDGDMQTEDVMDFVFAIISPPHAPDIISPPDIHYLVGSSGNLITWKISDDDLDLYKVYKDGKFLFSTDIEGTPSTTNDEFEVTLNIDGLELGTYIYTIEIFDESGFIVTDEVIVNVYNNPSITSSVFDSIISWNITDTHVGTCEYIIYRNGIEIKTGTWEPGIPVEISYAGLAGGNYEFLIYATDGLGGRAADFVLITVEGQLTNYLIVGIIIGVATAGIAFLILILRYRLKRRKLTS